jgi:CheY-like chemotaxis protein
VDDDPLFRSFFIAMLGQTGCPLARVSEAEDSIAALGACRANPPDLVFCDINLPRSRSQNGWKIVQSLRIKHPYIPVFMVTAENGENVIAQARAEGVTGLLLKPVDLRILKRILAVHLSNPGRVHRTVSPRPGSI